ncbi:MAG: hypothetical protein JRJ29_22400, partial [Deltaproteobacteria bacterium]|nr:hypothetical protein [Deltaproteobacteria bacterium]
MTAINRNPWQREGVSILPSDLCELMPLVGQRKLFTRLEKFRDEILSSGPYDLAGFFTIFGTWGVGKSRIGHEICLEAFSEDMHWIIDGESKRLLEYGLKQNILPLFVRYIQVTRGPLGANLEMDNWIPTVTVEALSNLAGLRGKAGSNRMVKNQDRILELARKVLKPKGWDKHVGELQNVLQSADLYEAARGGIEVLRELGIHYLWIVVDEIEDITDVERDGLPSAEREGIDQALLTVIPRVIKTEEYRQEFREINFLLLCSQVVGDLLKQVHAIERRTGWHELTSNSFADVEAFFQYLQSRPEDAAQAIAQYPKGLKEAAFFAANRNFGWFNVIMHYAHQNHRGGTVEAADLLHMFAQESARGHGKSVFNLDTISEYRIPKDEDYTDIVRAMFRLLPRAIGPEEEVTPERAEILLAKRDQGGEKRPLFVRVREISPPQKHRMLAHMTKHGFVNRTGTELMLPGEASFDLQPVIDSLHAYSVIALPPERREHLLICEDEREFTDQVKGLSPYPEQADQFAPYLHGLLMDPDYQVKDSDGRSRLFIGPAFSFLLEFNTLSRIRRAEEGYLRDRAKNTRLEEAFHNVEKDASARVQMLLRGIGNTWDMERAPVSIEVLPELKLPSGRMVSAGSPLQLGKDKQSILIYGAEATEADLEHDLTLLAKKPTPIILVLEDQDQRVEDLRRRINRNIP